MDYPELKSLQKDLYCGNKSLAIKSKIKHLEKNKSDNQSLCPVCGTEMESTKSKFTLIFGTTGFKKKAIFCEIDCLQFFISQLKETEIKRW